jgi:PTH1 family peptidyl-tRNA hydrolase
VFRRRTDGAARRGTPADWVVVGLANPGVEYEGTRHNIGGAIVSELADRLGVKLKPDPRMRSRFAETSTSGSRVLLAVPMTYMNESGAAVVPLLRRAGFEDLGRLLIVHDELDLAPGRLQLKVGGGLAGNNGLRSISGALGSNDFARLRVGIGKPPSKDRGADWVLSRPGGSDRQLLEESVVSGADAVAQVLANGIDAAIATLNGSAGA